MADTPDAPERVALTLLQIILQGRGENLPAHQVLDLFAACLQAVDGERNVNHGALH